MDVEKELQRVFDDYMKERNYIPAYARVLGKEKPEFLIKWFDTRRTFRGQGVLDEKTKELLLVAAAAGRMVEQSVVMHTKTAMLAGATKEEILEAAFCSWLIGGMPSLSVCMKGLALALEEKEQAKA